MIKYLYHLFLSLFKSRRETIVCVVTDSAKPNMPSQGDSVTGTYLIGGHGKLMFNVIMYDTPEARVTLLTESGRGVIVGEFALTADPDKKLRLEYNRFLVRAFLVAWHARLGYIPTLEDKPVPFPLPDMYKAGSYTS